MKTTQLYFHQDRAGSQSKKQSLLPDNHSVTQQRHSCGRLCQGTECLSPTPGPGSASSSATASSSDTAGTNQHCSQRVLTAPLRLGTPLCPRKWKEPTEVCNLNALWHKAATSAMARHAAPLCVPSSSQVPGANHLHKLPV